MTYYFRFVFSCFQVFEYVFYFVDYDLLSCFRGYNCWLKEGFNFFFLNLPTIVTFQVLPCWRIISYIFLNGIESHNPSIKITKLSWLFQTRCRVSWFLSILCIADLFSLIIENIFFVSFDIENGYCDLFFFPKMYSLKYKTGIVTNSHNNISRLSDPPYTFTKLIGALPEFRFPIPTCPDPGSWQFRKKFWHRYIEKKRICQNLPRRQYIEIIQTKPGVSTGNCRWKHCFRPGFPFA